MGSHQLLLWDFSNKATTNNNNNFGNIFGDFATKFSIIWKTLCERNKEKGCFFPPTRAMTVESFPIISRKANFALGVMEGTVTCI